MQRVRVGIVIYEDVEISTSVAPSRCFRSPDCMRTSSGKSRPVSATFSKKRGRNVRA